MRVSLDGVGGSAWWGWIFNLLKMLLIILNLLKVQICSCGYMGWEVLVAVEKPWTLYTAALTKIVHNAHHCYYNGKLIVSK